MLNVPGMTIIATRDGGQVRFQTTVDWDQLWGTGAHWGKQQAPETQPAAAVTQSVVGTSPSVPIYVKSEPGASPLAPALIGGSIALVAALLGQVVAHHFSERREAAKSVRDEEAAATVRYTTATSEVRSRLSDSVLKLADVRFLEGPVSAETIQSAKPFLAQVMKLQGAIFDFAGDLMQRPEIGEALADASIAVTEMAQWVSGVFAKGSIDAQDRTDYRARATRLTKQIADCNRLLLEQLLERR